MQRVVPQQPFGSGDRRLGITFCGALFGNLGECVEEPLAEPVAFGEQPLVVAAFQEVARVEVDRLPELTAIQGRLESDDVDPAG
jgi:hypothetical protein